MYTQAIIKAEYHISIITNNKHNSHEQTITTQHCNECPFAIESNKLSTDKWLKINQVI